MQAHKCMQRKMRATKQHALALHIHLQNAQRSFEKRNCMLYLGMGTCGCARNGDALRQLRRPRLSAEVALAAAAAWDGALSFSFL